LSEDIAPNEPEPAAPPPAAAAEEPTPPAAAPIDDDAALDAEAIEIPTGEKLVPLSAVTGLREKLKAEKADKATLSQKAARADELEQQLRDADSLVERARRIVEAEQRQPQAPPQPQGPTAAETGELEEIARDFDFYKADGSLDLTKAQRHQTRTRAEAQKIAQQVAQPLVQSQIQQQAAHNIARAKNTVLPSGEKVDAAAFDGLVQRLLQHPNGLESLANVENVKQLVIFAAGQKALAKPQAAAPEPPGPALFTERAGGRQTGSVSLNDGDKRAARDLGMTEAQYAKEVEKMPAGWGGR
jgi:hypothetical protein